MYEFSLLPGGNPAAVCLLAEDVPDIVKQQIAAEMNLSETAFLHPMRDHAGDEGKDPFKERSLFSLRWFTPTTEVPLCGHATLASAAVLFYTRENHNVSFSNNDFSTYHTYVHPVHTHSPNIAQSGMGTRFLDVMVNP